jgi:outer membrane receptor protein involved in Fe transport
LTSAQLAANPNYALACQGVAPDSGFSQQLSQITGVLKGTPTLKPETGEVFSYGLVYDSSLLQGFSMSVDYWNYDIKNVITKLDVNYAADNCVNNGIFCDLIHRFTTGPNAGQIQSFDEPIVNLGELKTDGIDLSLKYALRNTVAGSFNFSIDVTHINSYETIPSPGAPPVQIAGTYDRQFGNYAKYRGLLGVGWSLGGFEGLVTGRYIHSLVVHDPDGAPGVQPDLEVGSIMYWDLTLGYTFPTQTKIQLGGMNITDKQPPILYQNNVLNANTDVSTYDTLGARWFASIQQKF